MSTQPEEINKIEETWKVGKELELDKIYDAKITKMVKNILGNVVPVENLRRNSDPEQPVIQIYGILEGDSSEVSLGMLSLPKTNKPLSPMSNLFKFKKHYGSMPQKNMKVKVMTKKGETEGAVFPKLVL